MRNLEIFHSDKWGVNKINLHSNSLQQAVDINEILFCRGDSNYTKVYLDGDIKLCITKSLCEFESVLKKYNFLRCHDSYLVNLKWAKSFCKMCKTIYLPSHTIPISRRKFHEVLEVLLDYDIKEEK